MGRASSTLTSGLLALLAGASTLAYGQARCYAIDGDTMQCGQERVRLRGVYAAEKDAGSGAAARHRLQQRIDAGNIRIERHGRDQYGRTVADVYAGGRKISQADIGAKDGRGSSRRDSRSPNPGAAPKGTRSPSKQASSGRTPTSVPSAASAPKPGRTIGSHSYRAQSSNNPRNSSPSSHSGATSTQRAYSGGRSSSGGRSGIAGRSSIGGARSAGGTRSGGGGRR